jgi:hypothetical protein
MRSYATVIIGIRIHKRDFVKMAVKKLSEHVCNDGCVVYGAVSNFCPKCGMKLVEHSSGELASIFEWGSEVFEKYDVYYPNHESDFGFIAGKKWEVGPSSEPLALYNDPDRILEIINAMRADLDKSILWDDGEFGSWLYLHESV